MTGFDFRDHQRRERRRTVGLVALFAVLVILISVGLGLLLGHLFPRSGLGHSLAFMVLIMGVTLYAAWFKLRHLGSEGARVARALGAREVDRGTGNLDEQRYLNVVEEMAIAAGLPPPRAFLVKNEKGINAFAAGHTPGEAAIGVTHGALAKLSREELSGVIAHEMAHIANRDTRLNTRLLAMVFGLVALHVVGKDIWRAYRCDGRNTLFTAVGVLLAGLGWLGVLGGRILQSAVSQRREFLADATAVALTRNPLALAGALKKIAAVEKGSRVENPHAEEARHMFFAQAGGSLGRLLSTHPPLFDRIRALDPGFVPETDPLLGLDEKAMLRRTRGELAASPPPEES